MEKDTEHKGSCHCGTVKFLIAAPTKITVTRCNCSLCRRKGAIMATLPKENLRVTRGEDNLGLYQWNMHIAKHYFCKTCGIYTHHQRRSAPEQYGFNVGCLEGFDPADVDEVGLVNGAGLSLKE